MKIAYATLNVKVESATPDEIQQWTEILESAAMWGNAESVRCSYSDLDSIFSVAVDCDEDSLGILSAGMTLGYVNRAMEEKQSVKQIFAETWLSLHDSDGNLIESTL